MYSQKGKVLFIESLFIDSIANVTVDYVIFAVEGVKKNYNT